MPTYDLFASRLVLWNLAAHGFLALLAIRGYGSEILAYDPAICGAIVLLHIFFLVLFARRAWHVRSVIERARSGLLADDALAWEVRKNAERSRYFMTIANITVALTLIGNANGFFETFAGLDAQAFASKYELTLALSRVLKGPAMALLATMVGISLYIVQVVNARMLYTAIATVRRV